MVTLNQQLNQSVRNWRKKVSYHIKKVRKSKKEPRETNKYLLTERMCEQMTSSILPNQKLISPSSTMLSIQTVVKFEFPALENPPTAFFSLGNHRFTFHHNPSQHNQFCETVPLPRPTRKPHFINSGVSPKWRSLQKINRKWPCKTSDLPAQGCRTVDSHAQLESLDSEEDNGRRILTE